MFKKKIKEKRGSEYLAVQASTVCSMLDNSIDEQFCPEDAREIKYLILSHYQGFFQDEYRKEESLDD